jgi:glutaminase
MQHQLNFEELINKTVSEAKKLKGLGKTANYIPELASVDKEKFGLCLTLNNGIAYTYGDCNEKFSIQSIAKVFTLSMAISLLGEKIWKRVGVEPSGTAFNSLLQLEYEHGIPRNPFINSGAIVVADILFSKLNSPKDDFIKFVRKLANNNKINYNTMIANSEKEHGYRNAALANLLKSFNNLNNNVEEVLDFYFCICSLEMTCEELSSAFMLFANQGILKHNNEQILSSSQTKRINAIMQTCGFYDEAGDFTFKVGLPGKSGVGGGIAAVLPGKFSIAVWSPLLNKKGNSIVGMKTLETFTTLSGLSVF